MASDAAVPTQIIQWIRIGTLQREVNLTGVLIGGDGRVGMIRHHIRSYTDQPCYRRGEGGVNLLCLLIGRQGTIKFTLLNK